MRDYKNYDPFVTGARLKAAIKAEGQTQGEFAKKMDFSKGTLEGYISGTTRISLARMFSLSLELGVSADYLMGLSDTSET